MPWQVKQALAAPAAPPLHAMSSPDSRNRSADVVRTGPQDANDVAMRAAQVRHPNSHHAPLPLLTMRTVLPLLLALAGCAPPPEWQHAMPEADPARGLQAMARVGCGSCHVIPGLRWPQGAVGPSLRGFGKAGLVAGELPNRPDVLTAFVRDAPGALPGTTMPAMPLTEQEARDVAAYLYTLADR